MKFTWNLQLFASEDAEHPAMPEDTGETALDAGEQESFESLIRGQYKAEFDARVQKILDGRLRGLRQENEQLRREKTARKESARQAFSRLSEEEAAVQAVYPTFQWRKEIQNPTFGRLVASGIDARTAYEVVHREEILGGAMAYAVRETTRKLSGAVMSGSARPQESGMGGPGAALHRLDPRSLSQRERQALRDRVMRGERVVL